jgi:hypothetical protein
MGMTVIDKSLSLHCKLMGTCQTDLKVCEFHTATHSVTQVVRVNHTSPSKRTPALQHCQLSLPCLRHKRLQQQLTGAWFEQTLW